MNTPNENSATDKTKNKRYAFVQKQGDEFTCIKLLKDNYEGIIFKYDNVKFEKINEQGKVPLQFTYDVFVNPEQKDVDCQEFKNYIGDILVELVDEQLKDGTLFDKHDKQ